MPVVDNVHGPIGEFGYYLTFGIPKQTRTSLNSSMSLANS